MRRGQFCGTEPFTWGSALTLGTVRIDPNCRTPSWCPDSWRIDWIEKKSHAFGVRSVVNGGKGNIFRLSLIRRTFKKLQECYSLS